MQARRCQFWLSPREEHLKPEEIKEEPIGSLLFPDFLCVLSVTKLSCPTGYVLIADITKEEKSLSSFLFSGPGFLRFWQ